MIEINLKKKLHGSNAEMLLDVNLIIESGDFLAISGKSGSGKTTLLRILAGLESADEGFIKTDNQIWLEDKESLPIQKRKIGFVFQDYALFPNLTVLENLHFVSKDLNLANELLEITEISSLKDRLPSSLSGGQKQRVSLCRALMGRPKLLLMDEPLSALDPSIRTKLQNEILQIHKKFDITTIMVSHDPSEIYKLSNRVVILENGKIINDGSPRKILMKTSGSAKFSFEGELLDIKKVDVIYIAIVAIGQQIVEVVISEYEAKSLSIGQIVNLSTKAFSPIIK